jgi:homocysteine S-methyltransferase
MGSELIRRGIELPKHIWSADANINFPQDVQQIHTSHVKAGSDYLTTNTFRTTPRAYDKAHKINKWTKNSFNLAQESLEKAVSLAKNAAISSTSIIGSIAPLEDCYQPNLFPGKEVARSEFSLLGKWLTEAGVDILLLETMNSIIETEAALIALQKLNYPIWVSFVLKNQQQLLSGDLLLDALRLLNNFNVSMVLLNCNPLDRTIKTINNIVNNWHGSWGIYPNLGKGEPSPDGCIVEYEPINKFVFVIRRAVDLGATVVGACCGSTANHIVEIKNL